MAIRRSTADWTLRDSDFEAGGELGRGQWGGLGEGDAVNTDWPRDVFDRLLTHVIETKTKLIAHLIVHDARNHDAAGIGQRLQPRRHIDAITEMSSPSIMMSPTLMPMRNSMRLSAGTLALRSTIPR